MGFVILTAALLLGIVLGRIYGWMKYHYPEFQEEIRLRVARKQLLRAQAEAETELYRTEIDESLDARMQR